MQPANSSSQLTTCLRASRSLASRQKRSPNMSHAPPGHSIQGRALRARAETAMTHTAKMEISEQIGSETHKATNICLISASLIIPVLNRLDNLNVVF